MKQNFKEDTDIIEGGLSSLIKMVDTAIINAKVKDGIGKIMLGGKIHQSNNFSQERKYSKSKSRSASREKS